MRPAAPRWPGLGPGDRGLVKFNTSASRPTTDQSSAVTDARGAFEFRNLKPGPISLQVSAKGYVNQRTENLDANSPQARGVKVALEVGGEIYGTVVDANGEAKGGISVFLTGDRQDASQRTATGSDGKFKFIGLAGGNYRVTAQRPGARADAEQPVRRGAPGREHPAGSRAAPRVGTDPR